MDDSCFVWEDADDIAASLDLPIETLQRVGAVDLGTVLGREVHIGKDIGLGVVHQCCQLGHSRSQLIEGRASVVI